MRLTHLIATAAALSVIAVPVLAAAPPAPANPAAKLSLTSSTDGKDIRAGARTKRSNKARGSTLLLVGVGTAAVVAAALVLGNNDSQPASN